MTLREGERLMRDLGAALDEAGRSESSKDLQDATARLRSLQETIAPRVRELREMDEWRRFANAQQQEQLIAMAEAIVASLKSDMETGKDSDLVATARALRELNAQVAGGGRGAASFGAAALGAVPYRDRVHSQPVRGIFREAARGARHQPPEEGRRWSKKPSGWRRRPTGPKARRASRNCRPSGSRSVPCRATPLATSRTASAPPAISSSCAAARTWPRARRRGPKTSRTRKRCARARRRWPNPPTGTRPRPK